MSFIVEIDNQELKEKIESSRGSQSSVKNKKERSKSGSKIYNSESENLSLSDLDLIANKRKLAKKNESLSSEPILKESKDSTSVHKHQKHKRSLTRDSSIHTHKKESQWNGNRFLNENENPQVRREKSEYLYKFNKINAGNKFSSCQFDMNSPLFEIRNEFDRIKNGIENERSVKFLQRMMLLMIQGVEMLNTKFDPLGVDLDGWGESMAYSLETQEYDEVLSELYEKYKGVGNMSPEMKLMFMIISSASMFAITKKLTKNELNIGNLLGNLMGNGNKNSGGGFTHTAQYDHDHDNASVQSSTNDDNIPSKLDGPEDDISINDILSKMNMNKSRTEIKKPTPLPKIDESINLEDIRDIDVDERTEDVLKNIIVPAPKKRGRPPRQQRINKSSLQLR